MDDRETLVDPGMIEIALVIAAAGFLLTDVAGDTTRFTRLASTVFIIAGGAAFILHLVYILQWMEKHIYKPTRSGQLPLAAIYVVLPTLSAVLFALLLIFFVTAELAEVPELYRAVIVGIGALMIGFILLISKMMYMVSIGRGTYLELKKRWASIRVIYLELKKKLASMRRRQQEQKPPDSSRGPKPTNDNVAITQRDDVTQRVPREAEEDRDADAQPTSQGSSRSTHPASRLGLRGRYARRRGSAQDETPTPQFQPRKSTSRRTGPSGRTQTGDRRAPDVEER